MLNRCQAASIISITVESKQARDAFERALGWNSRTFENVKQLTFKEREGLNDAKKLYKACTSDNLQVGQCCCKLNIEMEVCMPCKIAKDHQFMLDTSSQRPQVMVS